MTPKRVLVVDDEPDVVRSCAKVLEMEGFEVRGATSGAEAIALYKSEGFNLVLVDLKIPDVDGLQVLATLREYDPTAAVIIFTAYGTKASAIEAFRLGACEFLEKPLDSQTLLTAVYHTLEKGDDATVRGNLHTMSLPNIIQLNCTERHQARLQLRYRGQEGSIFFADGNIVHAVLDSRVGEEVVYELLTWNDGDFELEMGVSPPQQTIVSNWSGLLLEGMRRIDESATGVEGLDILEGIREPKESATMTATKKRSEVLNDILSDLVSTSADIEGAVVVSNDGLVIASNLSKDTDATRVGASSAALLGLSKRTTPALGRGNFTQGLVQGESGNVIIVAAGERAVFVGLTRRDANLGMVFLEARDAAMAIAGAL